MSRRLFFVRAGGAFVLAGFAMLAACAVGSSTPEETTAQSGAVSGEVRQPVRRGAQRMAPPDGALPAAKFCSSAPNLVYYGGPVLQNVKVYSVNWGSHINATVTSQMPLFYADVVASPYFDWLSEYDTVGLNGQDGQPGYNQGIARGSFAGSVTISPLLCSGTGSPNSCALSDAQVRAEIAAQIAAGVLPAPTKGCDGWNDTVYMLNFDSSVQVTLPGVGGTCAELCAYHGTGVYQGQDYAYGVIPDYFAGACAEGGCGPADPLQATTNIASHELVESVTDPEVGLPEPHPPDFRPGAWHDATCGEIGDICEHLYGTINPNGTTWTVQQMWSNEVNDCITTKPSLPAVCTGANSPAGCRPCACSDNGHGASGVPGCGGATPYCETDATNIKDDYCVACTTSAECTSPATCTKSAVLATDDTCGMDAGVDSGSPGTDAGVDSGSPGLDSGVDSGSPGMDAGVDSGAPGMDSGSLGTDSGAPGTDSGSMTVDSGSTGGPDASSPGDAGRHADAAQEASSDDAGSDSAASGQSSGCGCRTAQGQPLPLSALLGLGALTMAGLVRRRRAAQSRSSIPMDSGAVARKPNCS